MSCYFTDKMASCYKKITVNGQKITPNARQIHGGTISVSHFQFSSVIYKVE